MSFFNELRKLDPQKAKDYDEIVQRIEVVAKRDPTYYRRQLLLLACLGYGYIFFVFVLINVAIWGTWQIYSAIPFLEDRSSDFIAIALLIAVGFFSKFLIPFGKPKGIPLTRREVPELFEMLDRVAQAIKAPKLHRVILINELNAGVIQQPLFGFIGWHTNYLLLGLPLMQALSPQQFEAVIAHEFAHLRGGDSKFAAWIYRIRNFWSNVADQLGKGNSRNFLFNRFFSWYGPFFKAYSFVHARAQEYEADRRAGETVGTKHKAEALIWLTVSSYFMQEIFWNNLYQQTISSEEPPDDVVNQQLQAIANYATDATQKPVTAQQMHCWVGLRMTQETNNKSTHPCLSDRLAALDYTLPEKLIPPTERAVVFLNEQTDALTQQLNKLWKKNNQNSWRQNYRRMQLTKRRLKALDEKPTSKMTIEERLRQALLKHTFQDNQTAIKLLRSVVEASSQQTTARYWLARLLLSENEQDATITEEATKHLMFVIDNNPALLGPACHELYAEQFMRESGPLHPDLQQRWITHRRLWTKAKSERRRLTKTTTFIPHDIPTEEIEQMTAYFASYPEIKAVHLARRVVEHFPEFPHYFIVLTYQFPHNAKELPIPSSQLTQFVSDGLAFSGDYTLKTMNTSVRLRQLKRIEGALIYAK